MKKAITLTINVGTSACPNRCSVCISEMTGKHMLENKNVKWSAFERAVQVAINYRAENVLFTGKGEPLLFPDQITKYLRILKKYRKYFTRFELQTSGDGLPECDRYLAKWKRLGLDLVALSAYHFDDVLNDEVFHSVKGERMPLVSKMMGLVGYGFRVRLSFVMMKGYIDSVETVKAALKFAKDWQVFQTTFRELGMPKQWKNESVAEFVHQHLLNPIDVQDIKDHFDEHGHLCDTLPFGGSVYEIDGQNACLTTCLDQCEDSDELRNLIFFSNGMLSTSWEHPIGTAIL